MRRSLQQRQLSPVCARYESNNTTGAFRNCADFLQRILQKLGRTVSSSTGKAELQRSPFVRLRLEQSSK